MVQCSFCKKTSRDVANMIRERQGNSAAICNECVSLAVQLLLRTKPPPDLKDLADEELADT